jgi:hypothetical protein
MRALMTTNYCNRFTHALAAPPRARLFDDLIC